ncbi:hypothetical protein TRFO_09629 [Tritrichomonas foetus]|uniref:Uncharacterized protein n=1 Tax=Tritrichomonas foetus TaxID=1144522 RepID=A0A1J4JDB0_9EUKA|nr:hypothetical protein TRFO_09629 [Tritrichomonas foetus]|eukprot:OHS97080.1 hypothetical protein TRFO_09629 [Tritrichomonas foetus]
MSSRKLDKMRVDNLLIPWLKELHGDHYRFLSDTIVQSVVTNAAMKGTTIDVLASQLSSFTSNSKDIAHFIRKYDRAIDKFIQTDFKSIIKNSQPPPRDFDRQRNRSPNQDNNQRRNFQRPNSLFNNSNNRGALPPKSAQNDRYHRNDYNQHQRSRHGDNISQQKIDEISQKEKAQQLPAQPQIKMPAYFLDSAAISLRRVDQKVKPLLFNEQGQRIDEEGHIIKTEFAHRKAEPAPKIPVDRRIPTVIKPLNKEFKFIDPGSISTQIEEKRKEAQIDLAVASGCNIFDTIALSRNYEKPEIDWWDQPYINIDPETKEWTPNYDTVNNEYENATLIQVPQLKVKEMPTLMSKAEQKRLKHITKLEKQEKERQMIHLNLIPKEPQKLKQSQMIKVNQGQSILAPTQLEMQVKAAKEYRMKKHEKHNADAKLTPEQRSEKNSDKRRKDFEDNNLTTTVFIVESLNEPLNAAKLDRMAKKWFMHGGLFDIAKPEMAFIVVEGGPKGTRKYTKLVEDRIKWDSWKGRIVFQGTSASKPHFYNFKKYHFNVASECRRFMDKYRAAELFDAAARELSSVDNNQQENQNDEIQQ